MFKARYDVILVIPIGPGTNINFIADTIESYLYYTLRTVKLVLVDDSRQMTGAGLKERFPDAELFITPRSRGGWAGLYINLSLAFKHILDRYEFSVLLKLDTDALIINWEPEKEALELFENKPLAGMAGQYPDDYAGEPWNIRWPQKRILNGTRTWKFFRRPLANWKLIGLHKKARANGYQTGESVFGGAYFMGQAYLNNLARHKLLPDHSLKALNLGEDHIFSLLAKAEGFSLESLSAAGAPMGLAWKGLPASPSELIKAGKKIIHSVRNWESMDEADIRFFFLHLRK